MFVWERRLTEVVGLIALGATATGVTCKMLSATVVTVLLLAGAGLTTAAGPCAQSGQGRYDYQEALCMSILFYEAERSGPLPDDMRFTWRGDSALEDGSDVGLDLTGGYFDAGDHVKFGFPMAYTATVISWSLLSYRPGFETAGQVAHAEAAIRWATDYFLKAHAGNMVMYGQIGDGNLDHVFWGRPEEMTMERPAFVLNTDAPGSDLVGETAAALAAASLVFAESDPDYSATCLEAARDLMAFADEYREMYHISIPNASDFYKSWDGFNDELTWGAIWMYKATGEQEYADMAQGFWTEFSMASTPNGFDWGTKTAGVQILFSELFGDAEYMEAVQAFSDHLQTATHTPAGMVYLDKWGSLRHAVNAAFIAFKAADLGIDAEMNREWAAHQVNYALGGAGRSYMIGFGIDPPLRPHHRASSCPDLPEPCDDTWALNQDGPNPQTLYGAIVGGPDAYDGYIDDRNDYIHNEVACDYNAALTGALAQMVMLN